MDLSIKNEEIKKLPILLGSSTYKSRKEGFDLLSSLLNNNEAHPETFMKGIIQLLISLIPLYIDRRSRHNLLSLIDKIAEKFGESSKNHLVNYYTYQAQDHVNYLNSNKNLGRYYVFPLEIGCHIWSKLSKAGSNLSEKQANTMGVALSTYFALSMNTECKKLVQKVLSNMDLIWKVDADLILFCETFAAEEMNVHKLILGGWLLKEISEKKISYDFSSLKLSLIQNYVRIVLQTKKKPSQFILKRTSILLKQLNHQEFSEIVLPVAQKNILRNPEIVLEAVAFLFAAVNIDLSRYIEQICKVIQSPLHAKEDLVRDETVNLCQELMKQCTESEAIESFMVFLFNVFNGSDGKLTVTAHRISVLQALEKAGYHRVSGNSAYTLSENLSMRLIKVLESETQEMALIQAISCLTVWSDQKFRTEMPSKILEFIPKALNLKSSTSLIRSSYFRYLFSCINPALSPKYVALIPSLMQAAEKAISQPSQIYMVTESLTACTLILKIASHDASLNPKIEPLWKSALDLKKNIFNGEKYLRNATIEGLEQLLRMSELLILHFHEKVADNTSAVYLPILWCLCCTYSTVRQSARTVVLMLCDRDHDLVLKLLKELGDMIDKFNLQVVDREDESSDSPKDLSCIGVIKGLLTICSTKKLSEGMKQKMAIHTLKIAYQIPTLSENGNLWCLICKTLGLAPAVVMKKQRNAVKEMILSDFKITDASRKLAAGVCRYGADVIFSWLVPFITQNLDEPAFLDVTDEDLEIYNTPVGVLYNQKSVDDAYEMDVNTKNMKKQSKAYSHKEQMIMIEEKRKEMEKKRKQGKLELTQKQKDIMAKELEKENEIRKRIQDLEGKASVPLCLLEAACEGNMKKLSQHFKTLVPLLVKYISSKLVGERMSWVFYKFRGVFNDADMIFGSTLGRVILLTHDANIKIPIDWKGEDMSTACVRVIHELFLMTDSENDEETNCLAAACFVYSFPLLEYVLQKGAFLKEQDKDKVSLWCLSIIKCHLSMRGTQNNCIYHPKFLPRELILKLIINIISTRDGRVQQMACAILADVCVCASGLPGCDRATHSEIYILLNTLTAPAQSVRDATLRGLTVLVDSLSNLSLDTKSINMMMHRLYVAKHDEDEEIQTIAGNLWDKAGMECNPTLLNLILSDVSHPTIAVRSSAAKALASFASNDPKSVDNITKNLIEIYKNKLELTPAKKDKYDHVIAEAIDHWEGRAGVAQSLQCLAPLLEEKSVVALFKFFVPESLGDRDERVQTRMLEAAMAVVNTHGKATVNNLLPVFEKFLKSAPNAAKFDTIRQSVVILMGSLAKHLDSTSPKIKPIVAKLIDALSTPSQPVQESVASCLYPLVPAIKEDCPKLVTKLMKILLESSNYGQRKGAAYGLASLVKGLGILSLKQLDIMNQLTVAIQDQKVYRYREGALIALEQLCNMLGKLFEPYIVHVLPHLLLCFGDGNTYVRQAADDTAKAVMSKLSAHGVKLVLPSLLAALEEDSWRTKTGSIDLLGNMAFCAPKQLSSCLPSIVPRLIEVLSDSHLKVQTAAAEALKLIGSVIRNPEIQAIVPVMLDALQDSSKNTSVCLQTLLETKFVHFIDAPSLALIMPVVQRAFQDRSTEVRKMSAQIIGNMYSLTDQKDLAPYLPNIIPGLKASLLDPVPKVRSVSARALGAMVRGMGESAFDDLLPWLMVTLTSEASPVDRSGAAQGLAEVVGGLGPEKLHRLMPDIVATAERTDIAPHVKDGYIMMFIFLPTVFEDEFTVYIGQIIPPILKALADENEFVRDTALRAGQRIVNTYASTAVTLLLPELENGLFHDNWRIRFSSVQLLGDLLYRVSGVSGKMTTDTAHEDDNFGTESSQKALINVLGVERRNRVLAGLYMGRSDVALMVRQAALHVWKVVVTNTPKTLREILPTLFSLLLSCLASTSYDKRQVAARTLGDLVRKLGERVLPEIIPILENGLQSEDPDHRQGVCIGLSEIMASTSRDMVLSFADNLVPTVRKALCDPLPAVREAAARTFDALHSTIGVRALDDILPQLLNQLEPKLPNGIDESEEVGEESEWALDGLKQVMGIKGRVVLPYLIPQLTATPVNTQALCILSAVAGETLTKHLQKILPALLAALSETANTSEYNVALTHCQEVILAVQDDTGVNTIVDELLTYSKSSDSGTSRASVTLLLSFCSTTNADYSEHAAQLVRGLISLFTSKDELIIQPAWGALGAVTKSLDAVTQRMLVSDVRQAVKFAALDLKGEVLIPGFCLPKGIQPVLPIFREAILNGEPEQKEAAANGLTEVIRLTSSEALRSSVVHITGPLIRILGDRFTWNVKVAVLDTLALLLQKAGALLKPFLPQLQTTFVKAVHDPHRGVRLKAGNALSHLITIHTKPDPLFTELHNSLRTADDPLLRETLLQSVRSVVTPCGNRMSETVSEGFLNTLTSLLYHETENIRMGAAGALGTLLRWVPEARMKQVISQYVLDDNPNLDLSVRHGKSVALFSCLKSCPEQLFKVSNETKILNALLSYLASDRVALVESGVIGVGFLLKYKLAIDDTVPANVLTAFAKSVNNNSNEVKQAMCRSCQYISEAVCQNDASKTVPADVVKIVLPMLVNASKEKNMIVRSAAEMALTAMLKMKDGVSQAQDLINIFEGGARDSLTDVLNKNLRKVSSYIPVTEIEMDTTLLT